MVDGAQQQLAIGTGQLHAVDLRCKITYQIVHVRPSELVERDSVGELCVAGTQHGASAAEHEATVGCARVRQTTEGEVEA